MAADEKPSCRSCYLSDMILINVESFVPGHTGSDVIQTAQGPADIDRWVLPSVEARCKRCDLTERYDMPADWELRSE